MRNIGERRKEYVPQFPQEEFVVPLIKNAVHSLLQEFSDSIEGKKVLDVGAGSQPFRREIESRNGKYHSLEIEQHFATNTDFEGAIDGELPEELFASGPYDFILCTEVLEHVANWDKSFSNFRRLLNEQGVLVATTPFIFPLHEIPYDFWRATPFAYKYFSNKHGLTVERCEQLGNALDVLGTVFAYHNSVRPLKPNLANRLQNKFIHLYIKYSLKLLKSRYVHRKFDVQNPFFHSLVTVIKK